MIGTSLALALAPLRLRVAVVEPVQRGSGEQPSFDDRSTALSRSTQRMFQAMGLWAGVEAAATPIRRIHVSDKGRFGFSHIDADEQKVEALGYVVINRVLGDVLHDHATHIAGLDWICPARIGAVATIDDGRRVDVQTPHGSMQLDCKLLIAADGAASSVREMLGIGATRRDYRQKAVIGNLLPGKPADNVAYERFTPHGPLAMLPIADGRVAFVWTLETAAADEAMHLDDNEFTRRLRDAFGSRLGEFSRIGRRAAYPLALTRANALTVARGVLVGNAAHGLHPVAAQGFNLGMRDAATLCDCLLDAQLQGETRGKGFDPGDPGLLASYAEWRRTDQRKLVDFTDGLVRLFGVSRGPVAMLRNVGMLGFDLVPGVRRLFARHTMGLAGKLPRLSRGVPLR